MFINLNADGPAKRPIRRKSTASVIDVLSNMYGHAATVCEQIVDRITKSVVRLFAFTVRATHTEILSRIHLRAHAHVVIGRK